MPYLRCLCLFTYIGAQHTLFCGLFVFCFFPPAFLRLVYHMLPVYNNCLFLIATSVFSNVYL
jgi:hypothetical protein